MVYPILQIPWPSTRLRAIKSALLLAVLMFAALVSAPAFAEEVRQGETPQGAFDVHPSSSHVTVTAMTGALGIDPALNPTISSGTSDHNGFDVFTAAASGFPTQGTDYLVISSGCTSIALNPNTSGSSTCVLGGLNNSQGNDLVQLTLTTEVPAGAKSWLVDFKFFSEEFPEYVGSPFNDAFLIEQGSSTFTISGNQVTAPNNVAFDANGNRLSVNTTGALGMTAANAAGTTYDGATTSLQTHAPVPTGATSLTLIFSVMDLGDSSWDTAVFLDNFRFSGSEVGDPVTEPTEPNAPPIVDAGDDVSGDEGSPINLAGSVSDADAGDTVTTSWTYTAGAGVDAGATCSFADAGAASTAITCTDDGTYTVTLTANDGTNPDVTDSATVTVANVAPSITSISAPVDPVAVNTAINVSAPFTDAGSNDTHVGTVDWGDGSADTIIDPATSPVAASHSYTAAGIYTLTVTVTDDDGGSDSEIHQYVVVYDPDAGFVTGGGWIDSPAGAYVADPTLAGKANFGFVSKYKKGATVPDGQTQFQFHSAGLNFHSTAYEWLVVSGPKAQYKGSGTINGAGDYGFMLTANDGQVNGGGGVDRFRIKFWDKATGDLVYDNQIGDGDDAAASDSIEGGSIVIHTKK